MLESIARRSPARLRAQGPRFAADVIYHPPKCRNRLPFELQCSATNHFKGFVELSSLPLYLGRFGARKVV